VIDTSSYAWGVSVSRRYDIQASYSYIATIEFHNDGEWALRLKILGPGLSGHGGSPRYNAYWRIDADIDGYLDDNIAQWSGGSWVARNPELSMSDDGNHSPADYEWRFRDAPFAYQLQPDGSDSAQFFALLFHSSEGAGDMPAVIWPGNFLNSEGIADADVVGWYRGTSPAGRYCSTGSVCVLGPWLFPSGY
jgi:hypothetical protein